MANGTGGNAFIDGYRVGGKTGTAQKVINGRYSANEHIVSFIGFAPADDPQIVVYTAVDNPQGIQFGGVVAAPIVRNIMKDALEYMQVPPASSRLPRNTNTARRRSSRFRSDRTYGAGNLRGPQHEF
ncbi:hypothetical protein HMSSN036_44860 [Paenibacillus macerans]|nr:hypothetical protein HMSSN036_44860 [Paenibacillus macerans]